MKRSLTARILLVIFFVALLATPYAIKRISALRDAPKQGEAPEVALARHGFHLEEVSHKAGVDFVHTAPALDPKLNHIMPQVASMGAAVSIVDFDRDGWPDIYVTNSGEGSKNALDRNLGDGTFKDVAQETGVADLNQTGTGVSMGAVWGDYDNDGYEDLFLGGYYSEDIDLWHLKTTKIMPESFEYAKNGGRKYLLHNLGNGKFEDVTEKMGINSRRWALAAAAGDLRGTG